MPSIKTLFIFEILGKPPEHIKESLEKMIDQISKQKGLEVTKRIVHDPKLVEKKEAEPKNEETNKLIEQEIYSTFAEVEIVTEDIKLIIAIVLNMLPSHVEIIEPAEFMFSNQEFSALMSELTIRMHKYDEVTKYLMLERNELLNKLNEKDKMIGVGEEKDAVEKNTVSDEVVEDSKE